MKNYPKGAIKSIESLMACKGKKLYPASRVFRSSPSFIFNGLVSEGVDNFVPYVEGFPVSCIQAAGNIGNVLSVLDMNVIENKYNDWFLFDNEEDADAYVDGAS